MDAKQFKYKAKNTQILVWGDFFFNSREDFEKMREAVEKLFSGQPNFAVESVDVSAQAENVSALSDG